MQIVVLILTCLASTPQEDCTRQTAIDIREVRAPATTCAMAGLATAASDPRSGIGLFTKIICGRPGQGRPASMATSDGDIWGSLGSGLLGAALGVVGTVIVALINRQPPMAVLIDARIRTLIEGYEKHVNDLQIENQKLEAKVDALTKRLKRLARSAAPGSGQAEHESRQLEMRHPFRFK